MTKKTLNLQVTREEKEAYMKLAADYGISLSALIRLSLDELRRSRTPLEITPKKKSPDPVD